MTAMNLPTAPMSSAASIALVCPDLLATEPSVQVFLTPPPSQTLAQSFA